MYGFTLLGPSAVVLDEVPLDGMAPQQMAVLAALAFRAGQPVAVEELVDGLYGEEPPASAVGVIANYVLRLRKVLGRSMITRVGGGYRLEAGPGQVDALVFVQRSGEAAREVPRAEAERLSGLLGLWRGSTALADLPGPWAERQRESLHQQREQVRQRWFDAQLLLGRHTEVLYEIAEACARQPYAEQLHASHMRALTRCGRQAEALAVYRALRATLTDELGIDPAPEVTAVHEAILRGEDPGPATVSPSRPSPPAQGAPQTMAPSGARPSTSRTHPHQLPSVVPDFTGRTAETKLLAAALTTDSGGGTGGGGMPVAVVTGMGGAGKTTLALAAAHRVADAFPGGQLYVDLRGADAAPADPLGVLAGFLTALGHQADLLPDTLDERSAAFRSAVAETPVLVVLDNAFDTAQVLPLLPGRSRCAALVTSRRPLSALPVVARVVAAELPTADAAALVGRIVGEARAAAEPDAAMELVETCARHPLALRIAASRLAARPAWSLASLADRLRGPSGTQVGELVAGDLRIEACFQLGYYQLTPAQARAFRLLAALDVGTVPAEFAAAALDCPPAQAEELCEQLVDVALLESPAPQMYRFHDLVRAYARTLPADGPGEVHAAVERLADACAGSLVTAYRARFPSKPLPTVLPGVSGKVSVRSFATAREAVGWMGERAELLLTSLGQAARSGTAATHAMACQTIPMLFDFNAYGITAERLYSLTAELLAAPPYAQADAVSRAALHLAVGEIHLEWVRLDEAEHHMRLAGALAEGCDLITARVLELEINVAHSRGEYQRAAALVDQVLPLFERAGDVISAGWTQQASARCRAELGDFRTALADAESALRTACAAEDDELLVAGHLTLGEVHRIAGHSRDALDHYEETVRTSRASGQSPRREAIAVYRMAFTQVDLGDPAAALAPAAQALDLLRAMGPNVMPYARIQEVLGRAHLALGHHRQAADHLSRAIAVYRDKDLPEATELAGLLATAQARQPTATPGRMPCPAR